MKRRSFFTTLLAFAAVPLVKVNPSEAKPDKYVRYYWNGNEVKTESYWATGQGRFELKKNDYIVMYHLHGHKPRRGDQILTRGSLTFRVVDSALDTFRLKLTHPDKPIHALAWTDTYVVYTSKFSEGEKS